METNYWNNEVVEIVENFDIEAYTLAPWYCQQQAENAYQTLENNDCVKAEYKVRGKPSLWGYTVDVVYKMAHNEFWGEVEEGSVPIK